MKIKTIVCFLLIQILPLQAFDGIDPVIFDSIQNELGLSPSQITTMKLKINKKNEAIGLDKNLPLSLTSRLFYASTLPGSKSEHIFLQKGFSVSLEILDKSGNPWNIVDHTKSDKIIDIKKPKLGEDSLFNNVVVLTPLDFGRINKLLYIEGSSSPISIIFTVSNTPVKHDRYQVVVSESSNIEKLALKNKIINIHRGAIFEDSAMLGVLSGIAPENYKKLIFDSKKANKLGLSVLNVFVGMAESEKYLFIRTSGTILAPRPVNVSQKESVKAYKISALPIIIIVNDYGEEIELNIEDLKQF